MLGSLYGLYPFDAEEPDEISFKIGEKITLIEDDALYNDGWYKGQNEAGKIGLFPKNFVTENSDILKLADSLSSPIPEPATEIQGESVAMSHQLPLISYKDKIPEDWDAEEVAKWVFDKGFKNWAPLFIEQEITGDVLVDLGLSSLRELGIELLGDRIRILQQILLLKDESLAKLEDLKLSDGGLVGEHQKVTIKEIPVQNFDNYSHSNTTDFENRNPPPLEIADSTTTETTRTSQMVAHMEKELDASIEAHYQTLQRRPPPIETQDTERHSVLLAPNLPLSDSPSSKSVYNQKSQYAHPHQLHYSHEPPHYVSCQQTKTRQPAFHHAMIPPVTVSPHTSSAVSPLPASQLPSQSLVHISSMHHQSGQPPRMALLQTTYAYSIDGNSEGTETTSNLSSHQSSYAFVSDPLFCSWSIKLETNSRDRDSGNVLESFLKRIHTIRQTNYPEPHSQKMNPEYQPFGKNSLLSQDRVTFPDYEGYLQVRLNTTQNWKKRYCMLKDGDLFLFKSKDQQRLLARVPIEKQYSVSPDDRHPPKHKFAFKIERADSRCIQFASESQLGMVQWITAFVRAGQSQADRNRKAHLLPVRRTKDVKPLPELPL